MRTTHAAEAFTASASVFVTPVVRMDGETTPDGRPGAVAMRPLPVPGALRARGAGRR